MSHKLLLDLPYRPFSGCFQHLDGKIYLPNDHLIKLGIFDGSTHWLNEEYYGLFVGKFTVHHRDCSMYRFTGFFDGIIVKKMNT